MAKPLEIKVDISYVGMSHICEVSTCVFWTGLHLVVTLIVYFV